MVVFPGFLAVIFPERTIAIAELPELHFTECLHPANESLYLSPISIVKLFFFNFGSSTVTLQDFVCSPTVAVISAFPFFFAVIFPSEDTDTTDSLEDFHTTSSVAFVISNFDVCPCTNNIDVLLILIGSTSISICSKFSGGKGL